MLNTLQHCSEIFFYTDSPLIANDKEKLELEETDENTLEADVSVIIKLFCKVDSTTNNYVTKCSFFKRKRVQSKYFLALHFYGNYSS